MELFMMKEDSKSVFSFSIFFIILAIFAAIPGLVLADPGMINGEGTHFAITGSAYLNVTLDSSEPIILMMESVPETINIQFESASAATQTRMTISGLLPGTNYYKYDQTGTSPVVITTDANGQYSFVQDISTRRVMALKSGPNAPEAAPLPGTETGTHFEVTGSEFLNVTVDSSETISMNLTSVPQVITMNITGTAGAASSSLAVCGLQPGSHYYKYEDSLHNLQEFDSDAAGCYSYTQDLTSSHIIFIQTRHSTKFIQDDATGGDCTAIGTWDSATKTCTLTSDVHDATEIDNDNITLDGNGHSIVGPGTVGVYSWGHSGLTIKNLNITDFTYGVYLTAVDCFHFWCTYKQASIQNNTVINNTIKNTASSGSFGIYIFSNYNLQYGSNNVISNNTVTNFSNGIRISYTAQSVIENNVLQGTGKSSPADWNYSGICLQRGGGRAAYNTVSGFGRGIAVFYPNFVYGFNGKGFNLSYNFIDGNNQGLYVSSNWGESDAEYNTISNNNVGFPIDNGIWYNIFNNNFLDNTTQFQDLVTTYWANAYFSSNWYSNYDSLDEGCYDNDANGYCDAPLYIHDGWKYGSYYQIYDSYPRTSVVPGAPLPPGYNQPPVANAGPDQTIECAGPNGTSVTLDGSGSTDPDHNALTYSWSGPFGTAAGARPTVTLPLGVNTITLTVNDGMGASSSDMVVITVQDTTPPSTSIITDGVTGQNGWYVSDVTVTLTSTDSCSGVKEIHYSLNGVETVASGDSASFAITAEGANSLVFGAVDNAGNAESLKGPEEFRIDKTAPVITITGVTDGAKYLVCTPPVPGYTVDDPVSGPANHIAALEGGNSNGVGTFTYTVTASDNAGNTVTKTVTYKVVYSFGGFLTPVTLDMPFRLGSTIPVKFVLTDGCGAYVPNAVATLSLVRLSGNEPVGDPIDGTTNVPDSGNAFRYDPEDNQYVYNLSTGDSLSIGTWRATVTLDDGETYSVVIGIK